MPELPEIETIRTSLAPLVMGRTVMSVEISEARLRRPVQPFDFERWVMGQQVEELERRAKYLIWKLGNGAAVVFHLGMSGRLGCFAPADAMEKHTHVIFTLSGQLQVRYRDPRRFGFIDVSPPGQYNSYALFRELGPEPLSDEFHADYLCRQIRRTRRAIKLVLMDSRIVPGLGNIYANEALFYSRIHPHRSACSLPEEDIVSLVAAVRSVLTNAIESGGTTLNDFRNARGEPGYFQMELAVYGRRGQPCVTCSCPVQRTVQGQRSSYFCPRCQRE